MDQITETVPFTEKPGVLYVAPLGTDLPDLTIWTPPGETQSQFKWSWPGYWVQVLPDGVLTDPDECEATSLSTPTEDVRVARESGPIRQTYQEWSWWFGVDAKVFMRDRLEIPPRLARKSSESTRFMIGWESEDCLDRVIARQAFVDHDGSWRLEPAYAPLPPQPRRRWWQRLMWWRPPPLRTPRLHPPFEIYRVGVRRQP